MYRYMYAPALVYMYVIEYTCIVVNFLLVIYVHVQPVDMYTQILMSAMFTIKLNVSTLSNT